MLGREGQILEEKVYGARDHRRRAMLISEFIRRRLAAAKEVQSPVFASIRQILFSSTALSIPALANDCYLSRRQFERKFVHYAGYSPKQFQRIARFNAVIKGFDRQQESLTAMALISLIMGWRAKAGANPSRAGNAGSRRTQAIVALWLGGIAIILSVVHLSVSASAVFGSGSGKAGAIVSLALALAGAVLSGLALRSAKG